MRNLVRPSLSYELYDLTMTKIRDEKVEHGDGLMNSI